MHAPGRLVSSLRYTRFTTRTEWTGTASELLGTLGEMRASAPPIPRLTGGSIEFQTLRRNVMSRIVTIEINPIPSGKLEIGKRLEGGILTCDRCLREEANED